MFVSFEKTGQCRIQKTITIGIIHITEHLQMFSDMDDADLKEMYSRIQMLVIDGQMSMVLQEIKY